MKLFVVLTLASLALAAPVEMDIGGSVKNFTAGLIEGLQNPGVESPCYLNTIQLMNVTDCIITDIETIIGGDFNGVLKLILDSKPMINAIEQAPQVCNFTALYDDVSVFFTVNGTELLISRATANMFPLLQDLNDFKTGNLTLMGKAAGDAFRRVSEWSL